MHNRAYWIKVFADAVECGMRTVESIPEEYRKDVEKELQKRAYKPQNLKSYCFSTVESR